MKSLRRTDFTSCSHTLETQVCGCCELVRTPALLAALGSRMIQSLIHSYFVHHVEDCGIAARSFAQNTILSEPFPKFPKCLGSQILVRHDCIESLVEPLFEFPSQKEGRRFILLEKEQTYCICIFLVIVYMRVWEMHFGFSLGQPSSSEVVTGRAEVISAN